MNRTRTYGLKNLMIGQSVRIPREWDKQHARVAASDYGRRSNKVFTCRMQEDGSMLIYRIELSQRDIDRRGQRSHRVIPSTEILTIANADVPTREQFYTWLDSFTSGQSYTFAPHYAPQFKTFAGYVIDYSLISGKPMFYTTVDSQGALVIVRN